MLLEGLHLPLTTPFFPDGRLNLRKLQQNVRRYSLTPVAGLVVLGPTGEAAMLSDEETREVLRSAIEAAAETKVMIAGVSRPGVDWTLRQIGVAADLGYDVALVVPPSRCSKEDKTFLHAVADRTPLPVLFAGEIASEVLVDLSAYPAVLGWLTPSISSIAFAVVKQGTSSIQRTVTVTHVFAAVTGRMMAAQGREGTDAVLSPESLGGGTAVVSPAKPALRTRSKTVGFQILVAGAQRILEGLEAGVAGAVPALAASAPQACYEVLAAWRDGDRALAQEKQERIRAVAEKMEELGVAALKYGCDLNGYYGGPPRLPALPLSGDQRTQVEQWMRNHS